jgi:hypothetical protein
MKLARGVPVHCCTSIEQIKALAMSFVFIPSVTDVKLKERKRDRNNEETDPSARAV